MSKQKFVRTAPAWFNLYDWRMEMGYTQVEAARVLGVGARTITYYEKGRDISWPFFLACMYVKRHRAESERMANESSLSNT